MANKIKYGLKNVYIALQTESEGAYTYDSPVACPGAKSVSFDANGESIRFTLTTSSISAPPATMATMAILKWR